MALNTGSIMKELLQLILDRGKEISKPPFSPKEWQLLSHVIKNSDSLSLESFRIAFATTGLASSPTLEKYFLQWLYITKTICIYLSDFNSAWFEVKNSSLSTEDLLPLLISALPDDVILLQNVKSILDNLITLDANDENYAAFINFYGALTIKIEELGNNKKNIEDDESIIKVIAVTEIVKNLRDFCFNCERYQRVLQEDIKNLIQKNYDSCIFSYYYGQEKIRGLFDITKNIAEDCHNDKALFLDPMNMKPTMPLTLSDALESHTKIASLLARLTRIPTKKNKPYHEYIIECMKLFFVYFPTNPDSTFKFIFNFFQPKTAQDFFIQATYDLFNKLPDNVKDDIAPPVVQISKHTFS